MADPTLPELAARVERIETMLGIGLPQQPTPAPVPGPPAAPTGFRITMLPDGRPQLDWDPDPDPNGPTARVTVEVLDLLNTANPVQAVVQRTDPQRSIRSVLKPGSRRRMALRARNGSGASPLSTAIDLPLTTPAPTPAPAPAPTPAGSAPGGLIDLSRWYLTLPIADPTGRDTSGPWDVYQPELNDFSYPHFLTGADANGPYVQYTAPAKGVTTSGSGATRCELREMFGPKTSDKASWSFTDSKPHVLTVTLTCDGISIAGRKEVIVGQIHGPGGTPPLILCVNHTRSALEVFRQGPRQGDLLTNLQPGELFTYRIDASGGRLKVFGWRGGIDRLPATPMFDWPATVLSEQSGLYYKAGAYNKQEVATATTGQAVVRQYRCDLI